MSTQNPRTRKLTLSRETVRGLSPSRVRDLGADPDRQFCTDRYCSFPCIAATCEEMACFR